MICIIYLRKFKSHNIILVWCGYQKVDIATNIDYPPINHNILLLKIHKKKKYFYKETGKKTHETADIRHYFISSKAKEEKFTFEENGL